MEIPKKTELHTIVQQAFPKKRFVNMAIAAGCESIKESTGSPPVTGTGMYSEIAYNGFDMLREIAMSTLHKLAQAVVEARDQNRIERETINVEDVIRGRARLRLTTDGIDLGDSAHYPPCLSPTTITARARSGNAAQPEAKQRARGRQLDAEATRYAAAFQAHAQNDQPLNRGELRRQLIELRRQAQTDPCLHFPEVYFAQLLRWVLNGIQGHEATLSSGAKSLIQFTVEETLLWLIKSTWVAVTGMSPKKAIYARDIATMWGILEQREPILQGDLPEYPGLDDLDRALAETVPKRVNSSKGNGSRFRKNERSRSPHGRD